jgi:thiol-disulfide isomerase/thioredoxin
MFLRLSVVFLFMLVLFPSCAKKDNAQTSGQAVSMGSDNVAEVISTEPRTGKAPNFSWKDASGKIMNLDSLHAQVTVLNFWATWCGPCKKELPDFIELSKTFAHRNVRFIGISVDRGPNIIEDVRSFVREENIPYQNVLATDELVEAYGNIRSIPSTFLLDADGKIVQTFVGIRPKEMFAGSITALLR